MMIQKLINVLSYIEAFVDFWGLLIVVDLENCGHAMVEYVGQLFEMIFKKLAAEKAYERYYNLCSK